MQYRSGLTSTATTTAATAMANAAASVARHDSRRWRAIAREKSSRSALLQRVAATDSEGVVCMPSPKRAAWPELAARARQ